MILVDTNILVAAIRAADPSPFINILRKQNGAVCGIVRAELLHGARSEVEHQQTVQLLNSLSYVPIGEKTWDAVGQNLRAFRNRGLSVPFPDAVIATLAITNRLELWTRDSHFSHIQRVLPGLRLFTEPL